MLELSRHAANALAMLLAGGTLALVIVLLGYLAITLAETDREDR